ncbi:hypothetical protein TURU_095338 [Turdus rufiventris]|nr:hypothetical protein TURU_095338 [Turdus rufiventris]
MEDLILDLWEIKALTELQMKITQCILENLKRTVIATYGFWNYSLLIDFSDGPSLTLVISRPFLSTVAIEGRDLYHTEVKSPLAFLLVLSHTRRVVNDWSKSSIPLIKGDADISKGSVTLKAERKVMKMAIE